MRSPKSLTTFLGSLAVFMALGAALGGCESCGGERAPREREPLSLLPASHWLVGSIELGPVRASKAYARAMSNGSPVDQYLGRECPYDPLPDVDRAWFGADDGVDHGRGAIIAFGSMDRTKILECFRAETRRRGLSLEEIDMEGFTVYSPGPGRPHLAWLDSKTVVIADRDNMEKVLGLEKGKGQSVRTNQSLLKLWELASRGRDVGIAIEPPEKMAKRVGALVPDAYSAVDNTKRIALGLRFMKGLDLYAMVQLTKTDDALRLHQRITRDLERWRQNDYIVIAGLSGHLRAINVETAGREISASAHLTERQVETLTRLAVDSIDEIVREGGNAEKVLRDRLHGRKRGADAGASRPDAASAGDGGSPATGDGGNRPAGDAAPSRP